MEVSQNQNIYNLSLFFIILIIGYFLPSAHSYPSTSSFSSSEKNPPENRHKLLVILLDGFRWDYYDQHKQDLKGFQHFLEEGVQAKWVAPVFPSYSYPSWTTISTGVYPETHGIIGNYMFDLNYTDLSKAIFELDLMKTFSAFKDQGQQPITGFQFSIQPKNPENKVDINDNTTTIRPEWWQNAEPIWTTATRFNKKVFLRYWSRCDVSFDGILPFECTGYREMRGDSIAETFRVAFQKLSDFDLVMVYWEHLDVVGHQFGPDSKELKSTLQEIDSALKDFLDMILDAGLDGEVNMVITSDHGITSTGESSGVKYISLDRFIDKSDIYRCLDRGPMISIAPFAKRLEKVYKDLQKMPGVDVYKRDEIPEDFHYKKSRLVQDILVVAKPGYFIRGLQNSKQIPRDSPSLFYWAGYHGWANMPDMRTIFFAKGPDFKNGISHPEIEMVDIYQIFTYLLNITAQPHNGSFERVSGMLVNQANHFQISINLILFILIMPFLHRYT